MFAFDDTTEPNNFGAGPVAVTGRDGFGAYFDIGVTSGATNVGIIIHNGNTKVGRVRGFLRLGPPVGVSGGCKTTEAQDLTFYSGPLLCIGVGRQQELGAETKRLGPTIHQ